MYKVGLADPTGKKRIKKQIARLLNQVNPIPRIDIVYDLFVSDLVRHKIGKPGSKALRFRDLKIGDTFIAMPMPGDDYGHGGFLAGAYLFKKIKEIPGISRNNAINLFNGVTTDFSRDSHVIKILS